MQRTTAFVQSKPPNNLLQPTNSSGLRPLPLAAEQERSAELAWNVLPDSDNQPCPCSSR